MTTEDESDTATLLRVRIAELESGIEYEAMRIALADMARQRDEARANEKRWTDRMLMLERRLQMIGTIATGKPHSTIGVVCEHCRYVHVEVR